jgi:16S rRNA (guanine1207-N2)-methyltransferase
MNHYFKNDFTKSEIKTIKGYIKEKEYEFFSDNNIFSKNNIDFGSKLLLESIENISGKVLDIGCGYGVIGIFTALNFMCEVDMIDVNNRAINICNKNIKKYNLINANVFYSDCYSDIKKKYNYILTNPPIRAGKKIVYEILFKAFDYLEESGKLIFVVRKEQGAKSIIKDLNLEHVVSVINKKNNFFIISVEKALK